MSVKYDQTQDTLYIRLSTEAGEIFEDQIGNYAIHLSDGDAITQLTIKNASRFLQRVILAGVQADPSVEIREPVWEDVDSSMISTFKYDETTATLEIMCHRTGIYRYFDVPAEIVDGLRASSSKGSYMRSMIIDMYDYEKRKR